MTTVSGVIPKEPVVAKTSGLVFEKSLVEKVLKVEEKCPVTGAPLRTDDLIVIQGNTRILIYFQRILHDNYFALYL